jgi:sugar/nucleoside kinase (ribokinase family)
MKKNNIKTDNVYFTNESNTGTACVMVDKNGNQISIHHKIVH